MQIADYPVEKLNNFRELYLHIAKHGCAVAFCVDGVDITYDKFCCDIRTAYKQIAKQNAVHIFVSMQNKYLFAVCYFAVVLCGKIAVLCEPSGDMPDCFACLKNKAFVTESELIDWLNLGEQCDVSAFDINIDISKPCTLLCSSGTTAIPKAIALSQRNVISNLIAGMEKYKFEYYGRYVSIIPYTHAFGLVCDLLGPLFSASAIYVPKSKMSFFSELAGAQPTALNLSPGIVQILLSQLKSGYKKENVVGKRLKKILSGGAATSKALCEEMRLYGINVYGCYGLSECSPCITVNRDEYYKDGSAGVPLNCNEVRIDSDGEICISGTNVMLGYYGRDDLTQQAIVDGFYHTGDLGYFDEDGFLYVTGRKNNLIVFENGIKLLPELVENDIMEHTTATEVVVTAVNKNDKIKLRIDIFLLDFQCKDAVEQYVKKEFFNYAIESINFTNTPFKKTSTGKIKRG